MTSAYPFPNYPAALAPVFKSLCKPFTSGAVKLLREKLEERIGALKLEAKNLAQSDIETGRILAERAKTLLDKYFEFSDINKALVAGAVNYYLFERDCVPDHHPAVGFFDDVKIMNHVLEQVGLVGIAI